MENYSNIGAICKDHANERLMKFQEENPNPELTSGMYVKVKFEDDENNEWMWVKITSYNKKTKEIEGDLDNDPVVVTNFECGDPVVFSYNMVCQIYNS